MLNTPLIDLPCAPSALTNAPIALAEHVEFQLLQPERLPPWRARRGLNTTAASPSSACRTSTFVRAARAGSTRWRCRRTFAATLRSRRSTPTLAPVAPPAVLAAVGRLFREEGDGCAARIAGGTFSAWRTRAPSGARPAARAVAARVGVGRRLRQQRDAPRRRAPPAPELAAAAAARREVAGVTAVALVVRAWPERGRCRTRAAWRCRRIGRPVHAGRLLVEYSLEPHVVLAVDAATACAPLAADGGWPSHPALAAVQRAGAAGRRAAAAPRAPRRVPRPRARQARARRVRRRRRHAADGVPPPLLRLRRAAAPSRSSPPARPSRCRSRRRRRRRRPPSSSPPASRSTRRRPSSSSRGVLDCGMHATRVALGRVLEELGVG